MSEWRDSNPHQLNPNQLCYQLHHILIYNMHDGIRTHKTCVHSLANYRINHSATCMLTKLVQQQVPLPLPCYDLTAIINQEITS